MSSRFTAPYRRLFLPVVVALSVVACQKKPEAPADTPTAAAPGDDQVWQVRRLPQALRAIDEVSVALRPLSRL